MADLLNNSNSQRCYYCKKQNPLDESHKIHLCSCNNCRNRKGFQREYFYWICDQCYKAKTEFTPSGNEAIDDFIKQTLSNDDKMYWEMEFVPFEKFKNIEYIAKGGFSKIYKATWEDGPITSWNREKQKYNRRVNMTIVLKELNDSANINSKKLNEVQNF